MSTTDTKHWADDLIAHIKEESFKAVVIALVEKIDILQNQLKDHHHVIKTTRDAGCGCCSYTDESDTEPASIPNESNYQ